MLLKSSSCHIWYRSWLGQYGRHYNTGTGQSFWLHLEASEAGQSVLPNRFPDDLICKKHGIYTDDDDDLILLIFLICILPTLVAAILWDTMPFL